MAAPSMVSRSGDSLVVRSVVSGTALYGEDGGEAHSKSTSPTPTPSRTSPPPSGLFDNDAEDLNLPQCKIKRSYMCPRCTFYTQNPRVYLYHLKTVHHEKIKVFECPHCLYASKHSQKLQRHVTMVHAPGKEVAKPPPASTPVKSKPKNKYPRKPVHLLHLSGKTPSEACEEISGGRHNVSDVKDEKIIPERIEQVVVCTEEEVAMDAAAQQNGTGTYLCSVCSFTSRSESLLTRHERIVHFKKKIFRCTRCSYVTNLKSRFTKHVKYHTMPLIKCGQCDFKTAYKWNLDRHHRNHGGPGAFHCTVCNFAADIKQSLTVHEMNHHVPVVGCAAATQSAGARRRFNKVGGSDCGLATEEDAIDADELELLRLEREETAPPLEGEITAMEQSRPKIGGGMATQRKPLPPLIPLQCKASKPAKTPPLSERDLNEICAKSCPNSTLKDFAPLIGDVDAFKTKEGCEEEEEEKAAHRASSPSSPLHDKPNGRSDAAAASPKKTFFDKLKEKLATDGQAGLVCATCGLEARCLSELVLHQQQQHGHELGVSNTESAKTLQGSSRSRCPHCRHRCKSSADLVQHLKVCAKAPQSQSGADEEASQDDQDADAAQRPPPYSVAAAAAVAAHPMENKVFVWNSMPSSGPASPSGSADSAGECSSNYEGNDDDSRLFLGDSTVVELTGVETAPGYGSVNPENGGEQDLSAPNDSTEPTSIKKVFKCPHCSFWASTASRFHVHIVGHLNRKPFECSLCAYRSNWRWDITKHIRLKSARDPSHQRARLLMTDETGRRNYSKYNKHLTLMRVTEHKMEQTPGTRQSKAAANGQQGNVAPGSSEPIPVLPAPPKLTRAPVPRASVRSSPSTSAPMLRPPPPLQAAAHVFIVNPVTGMQEKQDQPPVQTLKRPACSRESGTEPKRPNTDNKKTVWRCKQCHFRDGDRSVVLAHVKGHYRQANADGERPNGGKQGEGKALPTAVSTLTKQKEDRSMLQTAQDKKPTPPLLEPNGIHSCESCKFTTNSLQTLAAHAEFHKPHVDAIFKCYFCPYYVQTKEELLQHMVVHGVSQDEEFVQKTVMIKVTSPITSPPATPAPQPQVGASELPPQSDSESPPLTTYESPTTPLKKTDIAQSEGSSSSKRYCCNSCPYISNSKSQYLYHKQFHRSRGAVFKCSLCSYNVSRRHLLHQHLKVHGLDIPASTLSGDKKATSGTEAMDMDTDVPADDLEPSIDTTDLKDIPVCWVLRNKKLLKMFKCRFCPHVNLRRTNIQEHERMHSDRPAKPWETIQPHQRLTCELCSYTCNNAGVLSSHSKVHQDEYPRLCALVDPNRKDEDQIKELNEKLNLALDSSEVNEPEEESSVNQEDESNENAINIRSLLKTTGGVKGAMLEEDDDKEGEEKRQSDRVTRRAVDNTKEETMLLFCQSCPARFLFSKELGIHSRFHSVKLAHHCHSCSYTARHSAHLRAHLKVHTQEYHERTQALLKMYPIHTDYPMPLHTCLKDGFDKMWIVPSDEIADNAALSLTTASSSGDAEARLGHSATERTDPNDSTAKAKHSCTKCPATFFKFVALQYHQTLHGANHPHKCRVCDYAVKTYGNLAKHENIHGPREKLKRFHRDLQGARAVSVSGNDAHQSEAQLFKKVVEKNEMDVDSSANDLSQLDESDTHDESLYQGCPDFVYPTYLTKNGRVKEKRFKCFKCPSAFEKREQYRVHLSLHGSNQRYSCSKCDYSVKYYANFVQHLQKHAKSEKAKADAEYSALEKMTSMDEGEALEGSEGMPSPDKASRQSPMAGSPQRSMKTINRGPLALSMADRQTMMVLQQRRASGTLNSRVIDKNYWCLHCPYSNCRRDGIDSHMRRHIAVSGVRSVYTCEYCDYTVPTQHFLREHTKIHFAVDKLPRPETFMTCDKLELWVGNESQEKQLVFQDKGRNVDDRFVPVLDMGSTDLKKVFVNLNTGETIIYHSNGETQPDWDSCSEGTNKSEVVAAPRNGLVAPSQSSTTTDEASDTASSTRCSSRSSAGSDIDDDPVSRSDAAGAASVPNASTDAQLEPPPDPAKCETLTDEKEA